MLNLKDEKVVYISKNAYTKDEFVLLTTNDSYKSIYKGINIYLLKIDENYIRKEKEKINRDLYNENYRLLFNSIKGSIKDVLCKVSLSTKDIKYFFYKLYSILKQSFNPYSFYYFIKNYKNKYGKAFEFKFLNGVSFIFQDIEKDVNINGKSVKVNYIELIFKSARFESENIIGAIKLKPLDFMEFSNYIYGYYKFLTESLVVSIYTGDIINSISELNLKLSNIFSELDSIKNEVLKYRNEFKILEEKIDSLKTARLESNKNISQSKPSQQTDDILIQELKQELERNVDNYLNFNIQENKNLIFEILSYILFNLPIDTLYILLSSIPVPNVISLSQIKNYVVNVLKLKNDKSILSNIKYYLYLIKRISSLILLSKENKISLSDNEITLLQIFNAYLKNRLFKYLCLYKLYKEYLNSSASNKDEDVIIKITEDDISKLDEFISSLVLDVDVSKLPKYLNRALLVFKEDLKDILNTITDIYEINTDKLNELLDSYIINVKDENILLVLNSIDLNIHFVNSNYYIESIDEGIKKETSLNKYVLSKYLSLKESELSIDINHVYSEIKNKIFNTNLIEAIKYILNELLVSVDESKTKYIDGNEKSIDENKVKDVKVIESDIIRAQKFLDEVKTLIKNENIINSYYEKLNRALHLLNTENNKNENLNKYIKIYKNLLKDKLLDILVAYIFLDLYINYLHDLFKNKELDYKEFVNNILSKYIKDEKVKDAVSFFVSILNIENGSIEKIKELKPINEHKKYLFELFKKYSYHISNVDNEYLAIYNLIMTLI